MVVVVVVVVVVCSKEGRGIIDMWIKRIFLCVGLQASPDEPSICCFLDAALSADMDHSLSASRNQKNA